MIAYKTYVPEMYYEGIPSCIELYHFDVCCSFDMQDVKTEE